MDGGWGMGEVNGARREKVVVTGTGVYNEKKVFKNINLILKKKKYLGANSFR